METRPPEMSFKALTLLAAAGPVIYAMGLGAAAALDGGSPGATVCFDPGVASHASVLRLAAAVAMAFGAVVFLWFAPWLLGVAAVGRIESRRATAHVWSLAANTAALVLICLVLRNTIGLGRGGFFAAWLLWTVALLAAGRRGGTTAEAREATRRFGLALAVALVVVLAGTALFHREHFVQCFNGDGTEFDELAASLRDHFLPYWEIEPVGQHGTFIANPTVTNSYWTFALQGLLGRGELATRLPFWIWWGSFLAVALSMMESFGAANRLRSAVPLALSLLMTALWYTFYVGYDPYLADLANPGVPDGLFALLLLMALDCLRLKDAAGWVVAMVLVSLLFFAGFVMFVLMAAAALVWRPIERPAMLRAVLAGAAALTGLVAFYLVWGWLDGSCVAWMDCLKMEWLDKYFAPEPRSWKSLLFFGYYLLGCGLVPAVALPLAFVKKDPWPRTVATVLALYLVIIFGSGLKNLHYVAPLPPLTLVLFLSGTGRWRTGVRAYLAAASLAVGVVLCWPASRPILAMNRELGGLTTFHTDSYEEACVWGRIAEELYDHGLLNWEISQHTWIGYARRTGRNAAATPLWVTDGSPPSDAYQRVYASPLGAKLYCCDPRVLQWLARKQPSIGPERCPRAFQPIAIVPRPREPNRRVE